MKTLLIISFYILIVFSTKSQCYSANAGSLSIYGDGKTTGNATLDQKFNVTLSQIEELFGVTVNMHIINDGYSPNAYATPSYSSDFDGDVYFGYNLLARTLWTMSEGEYAVAGALAHECGHVLQFKNDCSLPRTGKERELDADFLAGYFMGNNFTLQYGIRNLATILFQEGDYEFNSPQHHGTPSERIQAMVAGYNNASLTMEEAYRQGIRYVSGSDNDNDNSENNDGNTTTNSSYHTNDNQTSSTIICPYCAGNKYIVCPYCHGNKGYYYYGVWYTCPTCYGNGVIVCPKCYGRGYITQY